MRRVLLALFLVSLPAFGQTSLALKDAVHQALAEHPTQQAATASVQAAGSRVEQARAGYLPRATYGEFYQTSNQPVFAFGSLLNQRRFSDANFAIEALNHPGFVQNFQSQVSVEQTLWDFGATKNAVHAADLGRQMTEAQQKQQTQQRIAMVARAYHTVTLAEERHNAALAAVRSAEANLQRAENVRGAGMATDADVLSMRVHLAAMREQEIRSKYEKEMALAGLNEAIGAPLDSPHSLTTPLTAAAVQATVGVAGERTELRQARLSREMTEAQRTAARSAYYPQVVARGLFEADRGQFVTQGGASWLFAAGLKWNVFDGTTRRRIEEAKYAEAGAAARERDVAAKISLEQRQARAELASAQERIATAQASMAEAEENRRILQDRYEAGLARVDELLRAETAVLETQMRNLAAIYEQRMGAVVVELANGTLREESNVLE